MAKADPIRVDLAGALEGRHVLVDPDELTMGFLEDITAGGLAVSMDALAVVLKGGDLPKGVDRAGLRRLKPAEFQDLCTGIASAIRLGK